MFEKLRLVGDSLKKEVSFYKKLSEHPRIPWVSKILILIAIAYAFMPFDLIPDFIPVIGHLDDVILIHGLILLAIKLIPKDIIEECRTQSLEE